MQVALWIFAAIGIVAAVAEIIKAAEFLFGWGKHVESLMETFIRKELKGTAQRLTEAESKISEFEQRIVKLESAGKTDIGKAVDAVESAGKAVESEAAKL